MRFWRLATVRMLVARGSSRAAAADVHHAHSFRGRRTVMASALRHDGGPPSMMASSTCAFVGAMPQGYARRRSSTHRWHDGPSESTLQTRRRRRGAIMHRRKRKLAPPLAAALSGEGPPTPTTRYTIDDSVCPPTDPEALRGIVEKHIRTLPRYWRSKPIANHTAEAFQEALDFIVEYGRATGKERVKVVLDGGCGTGRSSLLLGEMHRDCVVIGIDQSLARLSRTKSYNQRDEGNAAQGSETNTHGSANVLLLRAELSDFWRCCLSSDRWRQHSTIVKQYLLYPNPYPKKSRLKSRLYAHPAFPLLMMTMMMDRRNSNDATTESNEELLVVRSNWEGYLQEFKSAVSVWGRCGGSVEEFRSLMGDDANDDEWLPTASQPEWNSMGPERLNSDGSPLTNFEAKYLECGEPVYELSISQNAPR